MIVEESQFNSIRNHDVIYAVLAVYNLSKNFLRIGDEQFCLRKERAADRKVRYNEIFLL